MSQTSDKALKLHLIAFRCEATNVTAAIIVLADRLEGDHRTRYYFSDAEEMRRILDALRHDPDYCPNLCPHERELIGEAIDAVYQTEKPKKRLRV